jgi:hypothetical protein
MFAVHSTVEAQLISTVRESASGANPEDICSDRVLLSLTQSSRLSQLTEGKDGIRLLLGSPGILASTQAEHREHIDG